MAKKKPVEMTRRRFLGAAAAAPAAAMSPAVDRAIGQQLATGRLGLSAHGSALPQPQKGPWEAFARYGMPEWKLQELKKSTKIEPSISPDIDALRSVSWGTKIRMQSQRNYAQSVEFHMTRDPIDVARQAFTEKHKIDWA